MMCIYIYIHIYRVSITIQLYRTMLHDTLRAQVNGVEGAKRLQKTFRFPKPRRG